MALLHSARTAIIPLAIAALASLVSLRAAPAQELNAFALATASPGGIYTPLGRSLCHLFNRDVPDGLPTCLALSSGGSADNIDRLREGRASFALVQSDVAYWARRGDGAFAGKAPMENLRSVFPVHEETLTVLAARGVEISVPDDVRGKRIAVSAPGSGSRATTDAFIAALGWRLEDFGSFAAMSMAEQVDALCSGAADVAVFVVGHPNGFVQRALYDCGARLVPFNGARIETALRDLPFVTMSEIAAGNYRGIDQAIETPALTAMLLTTAETPAPLVSAFADTINRDLGTLRQLHPAFDPIDTGAAHPVMKTVGKHPALQ